MVDVNGAKGWRFRYRFVGKPKMISFGVYGEVSLAEARRKREEARAMLAKGINPSDARKADKIALSFSHESSFEAVAREWNGTAVRSQPGRMVMLKKFWVALSAIFFLTLATGPLS